MTARPLFTLRRLMDVCFWTNGKHPFGRGFGRDDDPGSGYCSVVDRPDRSCDIASCPCLELMTPRRRYHGRWMRTSKTGPEKNWLPRWCGLRAQRDSSGHDLCWPHPQLWIDPARVSWSFCRLGRNPSARDLANLAGYYKEIKTHWSPDKDAPAFRPIQRTGIINSHAIFNGLHHY